MSFFPDSRFSLSLGVSLFLLCHSSFLFFSRPPFSPLKFTSPHPFFLTLVSFYPLFGSLCSISLFSLSLSLSFLFCALYSSHLLLLSLSLCFLFMFSLSLSLSVSLLSPSS